MRSCSRMKGRWWDALLAGHMTCPSLADLDWDEVKKLIIGAEDLFLYHYREK